MEDEAMFDHGDSRSEEKYILPGTKGELPFFSLVIPVYNTEAYLEDCLRSVERQSFVSFEALVIDDGSTDGSGEICDRFAGQDARMHVVHNVNQGLLSTRIWGNEHCKGEFIVSLDSDDALRPDALEVLYKTIVKLDADLVIFGASRKSDFSELRANEPHLKDGVVLPKEALYDAVCEGTTVDSMALKTFRREYAPDPSITLTYAHVKNGEDLLQSMSVITRAKRPVYVRQTLYYYRVNEVSMNRAFQKDYARSMFSVGEVLLRYAEQWDREERKMDVCREFNESASEGSGLPADPVNRIVDDNWKNRMERKNLHTCAKVVRYYALRAGEASIDCLKEIRRESFFQQTCSAVRHDCLGRKEQMWLGLVEKERWRTLKLIMALRRLRHPTVDL